MSLEIPHTLRFQKLKLTVEELQMRLGEDDLRNVVHTGATAHIARFSTRVSRVKALGIRRIGVMHLGRHSGRGEKRRGSLQVGRKYKILCEDSRNGGVR